MICERIALTSRLLKSSERTFYGMELKSVKETLKEPHLRVRRHAFEQSNLLPPTSTHDYGWVQLKDRQSTTESKEITSQARSTILTAKHKITADEEIFIKVVTVSS